MINLAFKGLESMMVEAKIHLRAYVLIHNCESGRDTGNGMIFWASKIILMVYLLQQGHNSQFFPKSSTKEEPIIELYEPVGTILI